ncbi:hypothetical protein EDB84DRAFT_1275361, partial [Lactarius hengduanensis]
STTTSADHPERSHNAKAQVRRKAYIEQLERTMIMPQTMFALSPEQVFALPPPTPDIHELNQEIPSCSARTTNCGSDSPSLTSYSHARAPILCL